MIVQFFKYAKLAPSLQKPMSADYIISSVVLTLPYPCAEKT